MAIVKGIFQVTGGIKGMSFYTRTGSDKVIMRSKGGPSKRRIEAGPEFEKLRKHQGEWGACVPFARALKAAVGDTYRLADFNLSPAWTGLGKKLMGLDKVNKIGERSLFFSTYKQALVGYNFNKNYPLNSVLRVSPICEINRETLKASVVFPRINTANDLYNVQKLPYFRLIISIGCVSDMQYNSQNLFYHFEPLVEVLQGVNNNTITEWYSTDNILEEQTMNVELNEDLIQFMTDNVNVLLSIGIEFAKVGFAGEITEVKHAGCAKISMVV